MEDERLIRLVLTKELSKSGYKVLATSTAEEALGLAPPDLETIRVVVTDLVLPGLSGVDLVERLRERGLTCPVLLMSALPEDELRRMRVQPDMVVLAKPFAKEDLLAKLERILGAA